MLLLQTGQQQCYDEQGSLIRCENTGQDADCKSGRSWPVPRFHEQGQIIVDALTDLVWTKNANLLEFPVTWQEALDFIAECNADSLYGFQDWRLPNRREMRSLMSYQARKPSLPQGHPFRDYFLGWYWTSTTAAINPRYAWYVHLEGARMFYGRKDQYCLCWPVRGVNPEGLPRTGQHKCFDSQGQVIPSQGTGQDGEFQNGRQWPDPRFQIYGETVFDRLTELYWSKNGAMHKTPLSWQQALDFVAELNGGKFGGRANWRLPNINELESLTDCASFCPALPAGHPFENVRDVYWSSTTSFYETDWAWALYLDKGALGVGVKKGETFHAWPVC